MKSGYHRSWNRLSLFIVFSLCLISVSSYGQSLNNFKEETAFARLSFTDKILLSREVTDSGMVQKKTPADAGITKTRVVSKEKLVFRSTNFTYPKNIKGDVGIAYYPPRQLILYATLLKEYAKKKGYDTTYAFLCNMALVSNKKRFYIFNMQTMRIENAGLVSQGRGKGTSIFNKQYSNDPGSKCTALGRYKIGERYTGEFGESFRLVGLDSSNNKAYQRRIVLHSMPCIPDTDATTIPCASEGCPAVSPSFLEALKAVIKSQKRPVLLWVFDSNLSELVWEELP